MEIRNREDIKKFKETLPAELVNHPAFESSFDWKIQGYLSNGYTVSITLSDDKKSLSAVTNAKVFRGVERPHSVVQGVDINLEKGGYLSSTETYGELSDAIPYIQSLQNNGHKRDWTVYGNFDSYLSGSYRHCEYDSDGIKLIDSTLSESSSGLQFVRFDDEKRFKEQLCGLHKPREWGYSGNPKVPNSCSNVRVVGVQRDQANPGLAISYAYDVSAIGWQENLETWYGYIHTEYPAESLRVDRHQLFAKLNKGLWEVTDETKQFYPDENFEELRKRFSLMSEKAIEYSQTAQYHPEMYRVLRDRIRKANQKYRDSSKNIDSDEMSDGEFKMK